MQGSQAVYDNVLFRTVPPRRYCVPLSVPRLQARAALLMQEQHASTAAARARHGCFNATGRWLPAAVCELLLRIWIHVCVGRWLLCFDAVKVVEGAGAVAAATWRLHDSAGGQRSADADRAALAALHLRGSVARHRAVIVQAS